MPRIKYRDINLGASKLAVVETANKIIAEYSAQGFDLTLRQLYYQFVSRALIPNTQVEYKKLGDIINDGRLVGLIDWNAIVDRTRNLKSLSHWNDGGEIVDACAKQFHVDKWATQEFRPEVWIEKDALVGVIEGVCEELDVSYFSCRGYTSQSEMWVASQRLLKYKKNDGQMPVILHFGDHDPSGMDMTRDIVDRLELFTRGSVEVNRLALNTDQVDTYKPPPNPAKVTDSRAAAYIQKFGTESWELDALEPNVIVALIRNNVTGLMDKKKWEDAVAEEEAERVSLGKVADRWSDIQTFLEVE